MQPTQDSLQERSGNTLTRYGPLLLVLAICLPAPLHFFETFPNGWDQTEYAWCVKAGFLPHSPHVLFFFVGRLLALVLAPAVALSSISLMSGLGVLVFLHQLLLGLYRDSPAGPARVAALVATLLVGTSTVFVRLVATQEAYAFQLCLLLGCAALLARESRTRGRGRLGAAAVLYGCALAAHNGSAFALPALLVLVARSGSREGAQSTVEGRGRAVAGWLAIAGATLGVAYGITTALLPAAPGERLAEAIHYFRGISPGPRLGALTEPAFLADSIAGIARRLTSGDIDVSRGPVAMGPVGLGIAHLGMGLLGLLLLARRTPTAALFLALWPLPFLLYELLLGSNPDYGTYLVFVVPPVSAACAACGLSVAWPPSSAPFRRVALTTLALGAGIALLTPPVTQLAAHWGDIARDQERHDSPTTLAAVFAAGALPPNAVVVQPRSEWNANLLPFYAERRHVARIGTTLRLFRSRAPYTPMKTGAYDPLTTELLIELLLSGVPVISFEPQPLRGANVATLDASRFVWRPAGNADLATAAEQLGLSDARRSQLAGRSVSMFRAELAPGR